MIHKTRTLGVLAASLAITASGAPNALSQETYGSLDGIKSWHDLQPESSMAHQNGINFYELQLATGTKIDLAVADLASFQVVPIVGASTRPTSQAAQQENVQVAVNGGYFNLSNGESASFVVIDGKVVCDPRNNQALTGNPKLQPYLTTIFNRSEVRVIKNAHGHVEMEIAPHNQPLKKGEMLVHSLQAGPRLLPDLNDQKEAFVRKDQDGKSVDSIGCNKNAARTALGLTSDHKHIMLLCVQGKGQDEYSSGVTLHELGNLLKQLGCAEALNLDGGTSTTMAVKTADIGNSSSNANTAYKVVCGKSPETRVRSVLSLKAGAWH